MDDSPKAFLEELRSSILKKSVGQIALAVVLAEAVWRLINALTWYLIIPIIGRVLEGTQNQCSSRVLGIPFHSRPSPPHFWSSCLR